MVKSTVVVTLSGSKGKVGSRLGKVNGREQGESISTRADKGTGLLSSAMKKALGVQKVSKPAKQSPLRSISARLGPVAGNAAKVVKSSIQTGSTSEGIFGRERPVFRTAMSSQNAVSSQKPNTEVEGKVKLQSILESNFLRREWQSIRLCL